MTSTSNSRRSKSKATRQWMIDYFGPMVVQNVGDAPFVAMDGGKFNVTPAKYSQLIHFFSLLQAGNNQFGMDPIRELSLVPVLADKTKWFADVDKVPANFSVDRFKVIIVRNINEVLERPVASIEHVFAFKRTNAQKYHFYCVVVTVSKETRTAIWQKINKEAGSAVIDTSANTIRIEGFLKWDRQNQRFEPGSAYMPIGNSAGWSWKELYTKCWLAPRERVQQPLANNQAARPVVEAKEDEVSDGDDDDDDVQMDEEQKAELEEAKRQDSRSGSLEATINSEISDKIKTQIQRDCPEIAHILWKYPLTTMKKIAGCISFNVKKGTECKIAERTHRKNNIYLLYNRKAGIVSQRCYHAECHEKCPQGKTIFRARLRCQDIGTAALPDASDKELADFFGSKYPFITYEAVKNKDGNWFAYNDKVGFWKTVDEAFIVKLLTGSFYETVQSAYREAMVKHHDDADESMQLEDELHKISGKLKNYQGLNGLIKVLRHVLTPDTPIEWNANPLYTVFPNGVLQADKRVAGHPSFYYFGATKAEEYVNDKLCCRYKYQIDPTNKAKMRSIRRRAGALMRNWFRRVMPDDEDLALLLTFMSVVFSAQNYKKMIINSGPSGNNAKSSVFEFLIHVLGSYGMIGDKKLILKGAKDRVSKASLNFMRFVLFEEPDPGQPMDIEFLKDLVGGSNQTTGRFNFSNHNVVNLHAKYALNANVMSSLQLQEAMVERLLFFNWSAKFTTNPAEVDEDNHVYKADPKYKSTAYWKRYNDALVYLLLQHFQEFEANGYQLKISERAQQRTLRMLQGSDELIRWIKRTYWCLPMDFADRKNHFVTLSELQFEFDKLTPNAKRAIVGRASYSTQKFLKDQMESHVILKKLFKRRYTNWRISQEERMRPGARNKVGPWKQYMSNVLVGVVNIEQATANHEAFDTIDWHLITQPLPSAQENENDDNQLQLEFDEPATESRITTLYRKLTAMSVEPSVGNSIEQSPKADKAEKKDPSENVSDDMSCASLDLSGVDQMNEGVNATSEAGDSGEKANDEAVAANDQDEAAPESSRKRKRTQRRVALLFSDPSNPKKKKKVRRPSGDRK